MQPYFPLINALFNVVDQCMSVYLLEYFIKHKPLISEVYKTGEWPCFPYFCLFPPPIQEKQEFLQQAHKFILNFIGYGQ